MVEDFNPLNGFIGGLMIGAGALVLLLCNGRIAGISGIMGNLFANARETGWRLTFLVGLVAAPFIWLVATDGSYNIEITDSVLLLVAGGLLVGFGTRMGSGCTSGHGVCGLGRASPRSITATLIFIGIAMVTVYVMRHVIGAVQ
ncbi:YeeE/YedE family protein [Alphaproteobacteria bacterium HT1-32]|nr:YeeE/YedE family protein [Alphaproteobacteria bacterium HT1-32]